MWDDLIMDLVPLLIVLLLALALICVAFVFDERSQAREYEFLRDCMQKHTTIECEAMMYGARG